VIALLAYKRNSAEPAYGGHPLSFWVTPLGSNPSPADEAKARNAIDQIGAAAVPFLVKWIQFDPPRWKRTLAYGLTRTPLPLARNLARRLIDPRRANGTCIAFTVLGTRAMPACDDLCRLLNDTNRGMTTTVGR
jgi:hypothetical protein